MSAEKLLTTQRGSSAWLRHLVVEDRIWRLIDAKDQVLGRVAVQIACFLQGKHKPTYFDNIDSGDPVVVINARRIVLTGRKAHNKIYTHYSGYPGGLKQVPIKKVMEKRPEHVIRSAVHSMLPKNRLRRVWMENLRICMDEEHDHHAQKPVLLAPVHCGSRLGHGGPPTMHELETWWNDQIIRESDQTLQKLVAEERQLIVTRKAASDPTISAGLAQVLQFSENQASSQSEADTYQRYISAAEQSLQEDPVIVPSF